MTRLGFQLVLLGLVSLLATVAVQCEPSAPLATSSPRPIVSLISPPNNATLVLNEPVPVRALIKDSTGVLRVDLVVDGAIVDSQSLVFASFQYDYQYSWKPILLGAHNIAVLGYNSNSVVSDPASIRVNVVMPATTATPKAQTVTITPATSATGTFSLTPSRTWTPRLVVITPSPLPSVTATRTPTLTRTPFVIVVTETPGATRTPTSSPTPTGTK